MIVKSITNSNSFNHKRLKPAPPREQSSDDRFERDKRTVCAYTAGGAAVGGLGMGAWSVLLFHQAGATVNPYACLLMAGVGAAVGAGSGVVAGCAGVVLDRMLDQM